MTRYILKTNWETFQVQVGQGEKDNDGWAGGLVHKPPGKRCNGHICQTLHTLVIADGPNQGLEIEVAELYCRRCGHEPARRPRGSEVQMAELCAFPSFPEAPVPVVTQDEVAA